MAIFFSFSLSLSKKVRLRIRNLILIPWQPFIYGSNGSRSGSETRICKVIFWLTFILSTSEELYVFHVCLLVRTLMDVLDATTTRRQAELYEKKKNIYQRYEQVIENVLK